MCNIMTDIDNTTLKLSKNILKRYEPDIDGGTYFLFDTTNKKLWTGSFSSKLLLDLLDGQTSTKEIKNKFAKILNNDDIDAVNNSGARIVSVQAVAVLDEQEGE